jgi:nicotianamine synthase
LSSLQLIHTLSTDMEILNIDHDASAIIQSERLCIRLGSAILVVRSAHGLRKVLYPVRVKPFLLRRVYVNFQQEFDSTTEAVVRCLDVQVVVHPYSHVVNSVIVGRVRGV